MCDRLTDSTHACALVKKALIFCWQQTLKSTYCVTSSVLTNAFRVLPCGALHSNHGHENNQGWSRLKPNVVDTTSLHIPILSVWSIFVIVTYFYLIFIFLMVPVYCIPFTPRQIPCKLKLIWQSFKSHSDSEKCVSGNDTAVSEEIKVFHSHICD